MKEPFTTSGGKVMLGFGGRRTSERRLTDSDNLFITVNRRTDLDSIDTALSPLVDRPGTVRTGIRSYEVQRDRDGLPYQIKINFLERFGQDEKARTIQAVERVLSQQLRLRPAA